MTWGENMVDSKCSLSARCIFLGYALKQQNQKTISQWETNAVAKHTFCMKLDGLEQKPYGFDKHCACFIQEYSRCEGPMQCRPPTKILRCLGIEYEFTNDSKTSKGVKQVADERFGA